MGRSKPRKIAGQSHLKSKKTNISAHTRGGRRIKSYRANRWKLKHPPRKVILPAHNTITLQATKRGEAEQRLQARMREDRRRKNIAEDQRLRKLAEDREEKLQEQITKSFAAAERAEGRVAAERPAPIDTGALWQTISTEAEAEKAARAAAERPAPIDTGVLWADISTDVELQRTNQERIAVEEARQATLARESQIDQAREAQLNISRQKRKNTRKLLKETLRQLELVKGGEISPDRQDDLQTKLDGYIKENERLWREDKQYFQGRSRTESTDMLDAQMAAAEEEYKIHHTELDQAKKILDSTTRKPLAYKPILGMIRTEGTADDDKLVKAGIYTPLPETWSDRAKRKLTKKDRVTADQLSNITRYGAQVQYLDDLTKITSEASDAGRWQKGEVETLQKDIKKTREVLFKRIVEDEAYHPDKSAMIHPMIGDAALQRYIDETERFERQAGKYQRTFAGLDTVEELFKERRTYAETYLRNRRAEEQLNRPRTIVALTELFIDQPDLRVRENPLEKREIFDAWGRNIGMKNRFLTDQPTEEDVKVFHKKFQTDESLVMERARFNADVNASITRAQYLGGYDIKVAGKTEHVDGILDLQKALKEDEKPILTGRQMQEWIELHPDIEFGKGRPYDSPQVSPELAQMGATIDLKQLTREQLITSRRDPLDQEDLDLTLGLFKHPNKKPKRKRRHKRKK